MRNCQFGTMDWYCVLEAGHEGPHQSETFTLDSSPRPISPPSPAETPIVPKATCARCQREDYWHNLYRCFQCRRYFDEACMAEHLRSTHNFGGDRAASMPAPTETQTATPEPTPTIRELQRINQSRSNRWMAGSPGWTTLEIAGELAGEVGELANICKKLRRSEMGVRGNKLTDAELLEQARGECGDVFIVLMLTASKLGIDLYDATREAFNKKSEQMGFPERFPALLRISAGKEWCGCGVFLPDVSDGIASHAESCTQFESPRAAQPATTALTDCGTCGKARVAGCRNGSVWLTTSSIHACPNFVSAMNCASTSSPTTPSAPETK